MKPNPIASILFSLVFALACQAAPKSDLEALQGTWDLVYQQNGDHKVFDESTAQALHGAMVIEGNKIHYTVQIQFFDFKYSYTLDGKKIDLVLTDVPDKSDIGKKYYGIYEVKGDTLKLCWNEKERPKNLTQPKDDQNILVVLKRKTSH